MDSAICFECIEDFYLKEIVKNDGEPLQCSVCNEESHNAITVEDLGKRMEPIMRQHFSQGPFRTMLGEDDSKWDEQEGDSLSWAVQVVLGQSFSFEDEIIGAVMEAEGCWPADGDECFWDDTSLYVENRVNCEHYFHQWNQTLNELKYGRRFFSSTAQTLFSKLFDGIENLKVRNRKKSHPVIRYLPTGTRLYRSRICTSQSMRRDISSDPFKHVGPPPKDCARPGRMNPEGVVMFYGAREESTCLAEIRPALGNEIAIITLETTQPLRLLDFSRLERAQNVKVLSYFQPDFSEQVEKHHFLRHIHRLISQHVVPGRESDYLITQTMAEYLAHVYHKPFDGILFASSQHGKGANVVLFAEANLLTNSTAEAFRLSYVQNSIRFFATESIKYKHNELKVWVINGEPEIISEDWDENDKD